MNATAIDISQDNRQMGGLGARAFRAGLAAGAGGLALAVLACFFSDGGWRRFFFAYLVNFCFFLSLSLGALFFVALQHATRAGWSVAARRLAEAVAMNLSWLAALALPVLLLGMGALFPWARDAAPGEANPVLEGKRAYLNIPFFWLRTAACFAIWIWLARRFFRLSARQDATGDPALTTQMERLAPGAILLFALTITFFSFDWLMSLDPLWFSAIFGLYYFSGAFMGFMAFLALLAIGLQASGRLRRTITREHFHDVGKLVFAFVVFWAYIAFSQYMLIWYANLPEETGWIARRQEGAWAAIGLALLLGHFVVPFFGLISRWPKRIKPLLALGAAWVLAFHWLDIFWLAAPELRAGRVPFGVAEIALFVALGGCFAAATARSLGQASLLAEKDPRLAESLAFENV